MWIVESVHKLHNFTVMWPLNTGKSNTPDMSQYIDIQYLRQYRLIILSRYKYDVIISSRM